jgi:hypothetical protein
MENDILQPMKIDEPEEGSKDGRPFPEMFDRPIQMESSPLDNVESEKKVKHEKRM